MNRQELVQFMREAVDHVEQNNVSKAKFAQWLKEKFMISIKDMAVSMKDGKPYLVVEHFDSSNDELIEVHVDMTKYEEKIRKDLEKMGNSFKREFK